MTMPWFISLELLVCDIQPLTLLPRTQKLGQMKLILVTDILYSCGSHIFYFCHTFSKSNPTELVLWMYNKSKKLLVFLSWFNCNQLEKQSDIALVLCYSKDCIVHLNHLLVLMDLGLWVLEIFEMLACKDYKTKWDACHEATAWK